jgi:hypothetical protein
VGAANVRTNATTSSTGTVNTFWQSAIQPSTHWARETITQMWSGTPQLGQTAQVVIQKSGDLISGMFLTVEVPALKGDEAYANLASVADSYTFATDDIDESASSYDGIANNNVENSFFALTDPAEDGTYRTDTQAVGLASTLDNSLNSIVDGYLDDSVVDTNNVDVDAQGRNVFWVNELGHAVVEKIELVMGQVTIDTLTGRWMHVWNELTAKPGRSLNRMVGKYYSVEELIVASRRPRILYVPLPFFFQDHPSLAIPLVALAFHQIQVNCRFTPLTQLIVKQSKIGKPVLVKTSAAPTSSSLTFSLDTEVVYLDDAERNLFIEQSRNCRSHVYDGTRGTSNQVWNDPNVNPNRQSMTSQQVEDCKDDLFQMIHQVHEVSKPFNNATTSVSMELAFNHCVTELVWVVQRESAKRLGNFFNFTGPSRRDTVKQASFKTNNARRFSHEGAYFRTVVPYRSHSRIPEGFVYCYSFALHPEDSQPSGSLNFSRVDNLALNIELTDGTATKSGTALDGTTLQGGGTVYVFARNINFLHYQNGVVAMEFSN